MGAWDSSHCQREVGGNGGNEDQKQSVVQETFGRFQNISEMSLVRKACDFFGAGEMEVRSMRTLSGHFPNEGEETKGATGRECKQTGLTSSRKELR